MANILSIVGKVAFLVGLIFAIVGGIWGGESYPTNEWVVAVLLIAGILIGLLNVTAREAIAVLLSAMALILLGIWGFSEAFQPVQELSAGLAENVIGVVCAFALLMAPAAIIICIKAVIATARPGD